MQVTEIVNFGLKREIKVTVPASDIEVRLAKRLADAKDKICINGFRPGRVPMQHIRKIYGKSLMAEVVNEIIADSAHKIIADRGEKAAMQPDVMMTRDENETEKIIAGGADFEFSLSYEVIPAPEIKELSDIKVSRPIYDVSESEIEEQVKRIAESTRSFEVKKSRAAEGDRVIIDYVGKIDGVTFDDVKGDDRPLVLGSKEFTQSFEDQLIGAKAGDEKLVTVTFPDNYQDLHLAGREVTFDVTVKEVATPSKLEINDETAKNLGLESIEKLREIVRGQLENQFGTMARQKVKRQLFDQLDDTYKFEAPSKLIEAEFNNIWNMVTRDLEIVGRTFADEETTEEEARAEYQCLAERRVRLGLVLAEIGEQSGVTVSDEELRRGMLDTVHRYTASQQQEMLDFYRNNPSALGNMRATLFEEKVVDHLLSQISVTNKKVSKEELLTDDEDESSEKSVKKADNADGEAFKKKAVHTKKTKETKRRVKRRLQHNHMLSE